MGFGKIVEVIVCILCYRKFLLEYKVLDNIVVVDQYLNVSKFSIVVLVIKLNV